MKKLGIAHKDIKPDNLLMFDEENTIKIADFGISNKY